MPIYQRLKDQFGNPITTETGGQIIRAQDFNHDNTQYLSSWERPQDGGLRRAVDVFNIENPQLRSPHIFTRINRLTEHGGASANDARFSPDGSFIAVGVASSGGGLNLYAKSTGTDGTFTYITGQPDDHPSVTGWVSWSDNGEYLFCDNNQSVDGTIYRVDGGTVTGTGTGAIFGTSTATGGLATNNFVLVDSLEHGSRINCGEWTWGTSTDERGKWLVTGGTPPATATTEVLTFWERSADTLTKRADIVNAAGQPENDGTPEVTACRWSPDGHFLAVGIQTLNGSTVSVSNPQLEWYIFDKDNEALTKLTPPEEQPEGSGGQGPVDMAWSADGTQLAVVVNRPSDASAKGLYMYRRDGNTLTSIAVPSEITAILTSNLNNDINSVAYTK